MKTKRSASTVVIILIILGMVSCCCISMCGIFVLLRKYTDGIEFIENPPYLPPYESKKEDPSTINPDYKPIDGTEYIDDQWGYAIGIPKDWPKYNVKKTGGSETGFMMASHDFALMSNDGIDISFFTISIYTHEQWEKVLYGEEKVGENGDYVFAFSHLNGAPPSDLALYTDDLDAIKASFKLL